jgi:hypothetical protein
MSDANRKRLFDKCENSKAHNGEVNGAVSFLRGFSGICLVGNGHGMIPWVAGCTSTARLAVPLSLLVMDDVAVIRTRSMLSLGYR